MQKTDMPVADLSSPTPPAKDRDEDSGLHDIRNLASSQRSRLSSRRLGTNPPPVDEDILASTSGSWKSIALPEPAKMVSLPEMASLPTSKADAKAAEKAAKAAEKAARKSRPSGEIQPPADMSPSTSAPSLPVAAKVVDAPVTLDEIPSIAPAKAAVDAPMIGSRISGMKAAKPVTPIGDAPKKKRGTLIASLSVAVAAAAGAVLYISMDKHSADTATPMAEGAGQRAEPAKPTVAPIVADKKDDDSKAADAGSAAIAAPEPTPDPAPVVAEPPKPAVKTPPLKGKKPGKIDPKKVIEVDDPGNGIGKKPTPPTKPVKEPGKESDPDFDQLIKDSGYQKKVDKPKLDKKELSATDFRKGIGSVQARAMKCYNGKDEGNVMVKIFIAPSGSVTNVVVSGAFAGTPVAACVIGAVKSASFPAWEGPPASFNYSYLLSN
jgi:hypothetical protein